MGDKTSPLKIGDEAPDFELPGHDGHPFRLGFYREKQPVILFFYPKDDTPGCTAEACSFRDAYELFCELGVAVVGVSSDSKESHQQFAEKHGLPFTLLSDPDNTVRKLYGVPKTLGVLPGRVTYVIDKHGIVKNIFSSQRDTYGHIQAALTHIRELV